MTLDEVLSAFEAGEQISCELPEDFTYSLPDLGIFWLARYGITARLRKKYGIGYSPKLRRVVLPTYDNGKLVFIQARALAPEIKPKYLNRSAVSAPIFISDKKTDILVITEDQLSAIKVGEVFTGLTVFGTKPKTQLLSEVLKYRVVIIWLDGDKAGLEGARKIRRFLAPVCTARIIHTDKDPKEYNKDQIKEIVNER